MWLFLYGVTAPSGAGPPHYRGFTITFRHLTLGKAPLDEWSARRTDPYLVIHNTNNRQTSMPQAWFEPTIPGSKRPQNHAVDRATTGIRFFSAGVYWNFNTAVLVWMRYLKLFSICTCHAAMFNMIYLSTAIGLSPGGSSTVHIYTQTIHRTIQNKQYIEQHNSFGRVRAVPRLG
jgi:hypothetical protein